MKEKEHAAELGHLVWSRNMNREFGSANGWYMGWIVVNGKTVKAALTESDLQTITARADDNPEDMPRLIRPSELRKGDYPLFTKLLNDLKGLLNKRIYE